MRTLAEIVGVEKSVLHTCDWAGATNIISLYGTRPPWGEGTAPGRLLVRHGHLREHQTKPCLLEAHQLAGNRLRQDRPRRCFRIATAACCGKSGTRSYSQRADHPCQAILRKDNGTADTSAAAGLPLSNRSDGQCSGTLASLFFVLSSPVNKSAYNPNY